MGKIDDNIAINLKRIRKEKNMSLDMVAELTGVSKSMLGQIERGESNPTIGTISRIVEGIQIPYEDLLYRKESQAQVIDKGMLPVYRQKENAYEVKLVLPYDTQRAFEVFHCEIQPGALYQSAQADGNRTGLLSVLQGKLLVSMEGNTYEVRENEAFRFEAGRECVYTNPGTETVQFEVILYNRTA